MITLDVLTPLKQGHTVHPAVLDALEKQEGVAFRHYIVEGPPRLPGENRFSAIARARNKAKRFGEAHFVLFLDRDIVLPSRGLERLAYTLVFQRRYAALGISCEARCPPLNSRHVGMGAMLVYRSVLDRLSFRTERDICECYFFCEDVRRMGYKVSYLPRLKALHLRDSPAKL
jgi:hypothetical protein